MAGKRIPTILNGYFNAKDQGASLGGTVQINGVKRELLAGIPGGRTTKDFAAELKELSDTEKLELAQGVCVITGDTLVTA